MAMKSSKKAISQNDLRRIMNEQKKKLDINVKKIDSPLAKYDKGKLRCALCDAPVRSEALWSAHVSSREHLDQIAFAKRERKERPKASEVFKRPSTSSETAATPPKRMKGILKNSTSGSVPEDFFDSSVKSEKDAKSSLVQYNSDEEMDEGVKPRVQEAQESMEEDEEESKSAAVVSTEDLPEGFFDDPILDAKVRKVEYRDPVEEEWEKFQRAIKEEAAQSLQIIQEEQEEATAERQLEEIDEQMRNWSRVIDLERRKEQVTAEAQPMHEPEEEESNSADETEFDEFLDWRAKQS